MYLNDIISADRDVVKYLREATISLQEYKEVSLYDSLFEAATDESVAETEENNTKSVEKSKGILKKVFDAIMRLFKNIKDAIANFIDKRRLSDDEREAYDAFNKALKENPQLGNKKVTVKDFRKINQQYDEYIRQCEEAIKAANSGKKTDASKLISQIGEFLKNTGTDATAVVSVNVLRKMAAQNRTVARDIQAMIQRDQGIIRGMWDKALGEKESAKAQEELEKCTHIFSLTRWKNRLLLGKAENLREVTEELFSSKRSLADLVRLSSKTEHLGKVVGVAKDVAIDSTKDAVAQKANETKRGIKGAIDKINPLSEDKQKARDKKNRKDFYSFKKNKI